MTRALQFGRTFQRLIAAIDQSPSNLELSFEEITAKILFPINHKVNDPFLFQTKISRKLLAGIHALMFGLVPSSRNHKTGPNNKPNLEPRGTLG